ncbi:hypothetical protein BDV11DRAFT_170848 [Aspergillus similis]
MSEYNIGPTAFLATIWVCVGVQCVFLVCRLVLRVKLDRRWLAEDMFVLISWLLSLANTCLWTVVREQLYLFTAFTRASDLGSDMQLPANISRMATRYLRSQLAGYYLSYLSLWCVKLSFVFFFYKLGSKYRLQRILWWTVLVLVIASFGGCMGMLNYSCGLSSFEDMLENCSNAHSIWYQRVSLRVAPALDIVTDAAIIFLSGNSLWRTRITGLKKIALIGISLLTAFIIIIALIRMILGQSSSVMVDPAWLNVWNAIEILVAIIVACLASFWTFYNKSKQSKSQFTSNSSGFRSDNTSMEAPILLRDNDSIADTAHQKSIVYLHRWDVL